MNARYRLTAILLMLAVLLSPAASTGQSPTHEVSAERALVRAKTLYAQGELAEALDWVDRAQELISAELDLAEEAAAEGPPILELETVETALARGNTAQLIDVLSYYGDYAYGSNVEQDAEFDAMMSYLTLVHRVENEMPRPSRFDGHSVSTWADGRVHRIGSLNVSHWADGRIHRIGDFNISYWADGRPHRMGSINFSYWASKAAPHRVGDVNIP